MREPMTMTAEAERDIFEKPRGVPQAHEIDRLFAEIDALRAALDAAEAERAARDEALIRSAAEFLWQDRPEEDMIDIVRTQHENLLACAAADQRALLRVSRAAKALRGWDAIGALLSGDEPHAEDAQNELRELDAALSQQWTAARQCRELRLRADTDAKAKAAWERLYNERNWREEADRVGAVKLLLEANGCDCDCDHDESHDAACRISWAIET